MPKKRKNPKKSDIALAVETPLAKQVTEHISTSASAPKEIAKEREPFRGLNTPSGQTRWAPSTVKGPDGLNDFERSWLKVFKESGDPTYAALVAYKLTPDTQHLAKKIASRNKKLLARHYQDRWEMMELGDSVLQDIILNAARAMKTGINQQTGMVVESTAPDHGTRIAAAKLLMDLRGLKAPTKSQVDINHNMSRQLSDVLDKVDHKGGDDIIDGEFTSVGPTAEELSDILGDTEDGG